MSKRYYLQVLLTSGVTSTWNTITEVNKAQALSLQNILYEHAISFMEQLKGTLEDAVDDVDAVKEIQEVLCREDDDDETLIIPEYDIQEIDISMVKLKGSNTLPTIPFVTFSAKISAEELQEEISKALETINRILERQDFTELIETTRYRVVEVQSDNNLNQSHPHRNTRHLKSEQPKKIYPFW